MSDLISRADAIEAVEQAIFNHDSAIMRITELPSADAVHESCEDCPLYDKERHNCPRFNKVIPKTLAEAAQEWIPCSERLPEEGEKVLASTTNTVFTQVFKGTHGTSDSWWWNNNTIKTIYAWMPLPEPYREEKQNG